MTGTAGDDKGRFSCEPEVTAKIGRRGWAIYEVPISHSGRTCAEGKKTTWKDGVRAMWSIVRYNLFDRSDPGRR